MDDPRLAIIPILDYFPTWHGIAMEWISMEALRAVFLSKNMRFGSPRHWKQFRQAISRAGIWLRAYHDRTSDIRLEPFPKDDIRLEFEAVINDLSQYTSGTSLNVVVNAFDRVLTTLEGKTVPVGELHGDFTLGNVFVTPQGRVGGIDFEGVAPGPVYRDIARLIVDIEVHKAIRHGYIVHWFRWRRCIAIFLEGYFQSDIYDKRMLNLFCALEVVKRWLRFEISHANSKGLKGKLFQGLLICIRVYMRRLLVKKYLSEND
jgi:hypothetical protein